VSSRPSRSGSSPAHSMRVRTAASASAWLGRVLAGMLRPPRRWVSTSSPQLRFSGRMTLRGVAARVAAGFPCFLTRRPMADDASAHPDVLNATAQGQLKSIIERVERLEIEKGEIAEQIKEVFAEAKGNGF